MTFFLGHLILSPTYKIPFNDSSLCNLLTMDWNGHIISITLIDSGLLLMESELLNPFSLREMISGFNFTKIMFCNISDLLILLQAIELTLNSFILNPNSVVRGLMIQPAPSRSPRITVKKHWINFKLIIYILGKVMKESSSTLLSEKSEKSADCRLNHL